MHAKTTRYSRQICLPEIGQEGQERLLKASVLCVGAGGLGSPALLYLAAAGVGRIGIIDFDCVDESNLQRQILFSMKMVGQSKAREAAEKLKELNPSIHIECHEEELNTDSAAQLFPNYDIILDGTDNFETKFLINDAAVKFGKPWVYGSIQGFDGQASVFNYKGGPCYRCLQPDKPKSRIMNCAEAGVIGAVAGIIGVTQALQVIQLISGHDNFEPLTGKLWLLDTRTMHTKTLALKKNRHCSTCCQNPEHVILRYASPVCDFVPEISALQLRKKSGYVLIDVRETEEWEQGHIHGAILWPLSRLRAGDMPAEKKDCEIIVHCQKGMRSLEAARLMRDHGFIDVTSLSGGYESWQTDT
jgi:adenylyltransferase/sulfurtransferase